MPAENRYAKDIEVILSHRYDQGADLWTSPDKRIIKGAPFSTMESILYLLELGVEATEPVVEAAGRLVWSTWQNDGRFKVYPTGAIYPCQTIHIARLLCHMGWAEDERLQITRNYLLNTQYQDGGWRCKKFSYGRGPETEYSNPLPTLYALDIFRHTEHLNNNEQLDKAVEFLLQHWTIKKPIGPCQYGIGTLFMQVEYPFRNYNLFAYVYILSFYNRAKQDERFLEALSMLESKMEDGKIVVERVVPKLAKLDFCRKGQPSERATSRYQEILYNLGRQ